MAPLLLKSVTPARPNLALICAALHRNLISLRCGLGGIFSCIFFTCNDLVLVLFSSIYLKHVKTDKEKK